MKNRIKEFRKQHKLTMQALAEKTGTTASQINKLEKGERRLTADWMYRIAAALDIHPTALFPQQESAPLHSGAPKNAADQNTIHIPVCNAAQEGACWHLPQNVLKQASATDIAPALVQVHQDELEPDVSRGDYVLINRNDRHPVPAGIFVTQDESRGHILEFCKDVQKDGASFIQVTQITREKAADGQMQLTKKKALRRPEHIKITGRVIAHWHWL